MKNRNIAVNLRKILDALQITSEQNIQSVFVALDFDRVDHSALYNIMQWFNFGPNLIKWVQLLFNQINFTVINNGYTSNFFVPSRGVFQGNPIASFLFVLVIELLATKLCNNQKIKGISVLDQELLLILFTDDLGLLLEYNQESWNQTMNELSQFQQQSGMLINYNKTEVYRIGSLRNTQASFYSSNKLHWTNELIKVLGIYITQDHNQLITMNIEPVLMKVKVTLQLWEKRDLSLLGKIEIVNALVGLLFVYKMSVLPNIGEDYHKK